MRLRALAPTDPARLSLAEQSSDNYAELRKEVLMWQHHALADADLLL